MPPPPPTPVARARTAPRVVAALIAAAVILGLGDTPLVEDSLFWWVPQALIVAEDGPTLVPAGALPEAVRVGLGDGPVPPQWAGGIPDYAHPPLWFHWMGLWLAALGPTVWAVRLGCLPVGIALAVGFVALAERLGRPWAGLGALAAPPVLAQLLRPELDLPLLAVVPWALVALTDGRWRAFAALGLVAPWLKEPGVLLVLPALARCAQERRLRPAAFAPLIGLGAWSLAHGGLASPERLPGGLLSYLRDDLPAALRLVAFEQGRLLLLIGAALALRGPRRPALVPVLALAVGWALFFSVVGFRLQPHNPEPLTHVRYFGPAFALLGVLGALRAPPLALVGLPWLLARSPYGPEASLYGPAVARAEAEAAPWVQAEIAEGGRVWVGSYTVAAWTQPWAGYVDQPLDVHLMYAMGADPSAVAPGDLVLRVPTGEPAGALLRGRRADVERAWGWGGARVEAVRVR